MNGGIATGRRELAAIVFVDLVGFTSLTQHNERYALAQLDEFRGLVRGALKLHSGREVKSVGDALLLHFGSALDATRFAIRVQRQLAQRNGQNPRTPPLQARIGIHAGEIVVAENDIYGDVVNVASRVHGETVPGGICVTRTVYDQLRNHWDIAVSRLRNVTLKNVIEPVELYKVDPFGKRARSAKPAAMGVTTLAALGLVGYGVFGSKLRHALRPPAEQMEVATSQTDPEPVLQTESPISRPEEVRLPAPSAPESPSAAMPDAIARTQAFAHRFGMPREVRESLEELEKAGTEPERAKQVLASHLALLERLATELSREGVSTESMPGLIQAMQRQIQSQAGEGKLNPGIPPLLQRLEASLHDGDLKAANELRKDIEAKLGEK